jgi:predicted CXXCH cytochrome family protein
VHRFDLSLVKATSFVLGYLILLILLSSGPADAFFPTDPQIPTGRQRMENSSKECAICHFRWIESFGREAPATASGSIDRGRQAGSSDMCLSCHDGSVVDSRLKVWTSSNHVSGKPPPEWVEVPTDKFPLDENGHMTCATCHSAHAIEDGADIATVIFLREPNVNSSLCIFCHARFSGDESIHHPLGKQTERVPRAILDAGGRTSSDGRDIFCQTCHEPHGSRNHKMLVLPPSRLCVSCHTEKSAELSDVTTDAMHRMGQTYSGFRPPREFVDIGARFGPRGELSCLSCHRMHRGAHREALLIEDNNQGSLCMQCHEVQRAVTGGIHDMERSAPDAVNIDGLTAAESGVCGVCHKSHGWARDRRPGEPANFPLCAECHLGGGLASDKRPYVELHPVNVAMPDDQQIDLPLKGLERIITCATCHDPHSDGDSVSMLRMSGNELCTHCHEGKQAVFAGLHDPVKSSWATERGFQSQGLCTECHPVHKIRDKPGIWTLLGEEGPDRLRCEDCHREDGLDEPVATRHLAKTMDLPLSFPLKGDGTSESGEIVCATCHEIHHEQKGNKLLRASREDSKLCLPCHPDSQSLLGTPHDFRHSDLDFPEILPEEIEESGPCETCHLVHDPQHGMGPWAFETDGGKDYVKSLCTSCHRPGQPGEKSIPEFPDHPDTALYNRVHSEQEGYFPTYNEDGEHSSTGAISCLSCHDPHLGTPVQESGPSTTPSAMGKFLRPYSQQKLCDDCHGKESIWRYLYFHKREVLPFYRPRSER